jgi:hypothetical protein
MRPSFAHNDDAISKNRLASGKEGSSAPKGACQPFRHAWRLNHYNDKSLLAGRLLCPSMCPTFNAPVSAGILDALAVAIV